MGSDTRSLGPRSRVGKRVGGPRRKAVTGKTVAVEEEPSPSFEEILSDDHEQSPTTAITLAKPGDPYVTVSGKVLSPISEDKKANPEREGTKAINPAAFRGSKRLVISDLGVPTNVLNACALVFFYTVIGISDREIADAVGADVEHVKKVRDLPAYSECFERITGEFVNANSNLLNFRIAAYGHAAVSAIGDIITDDEAKPETRLRASSDMLDRGGMRPQDTAQRSMSMKNELRIVIVNGNEQSDINLGQGVNLEVVDNDNNDA